MEQKTTGERERERRREIKKKKEPSMHATLNNLPKRKQVSAARRCLLVNGVSSSIACVTVVNTLVPKRNVSVRNCGLVWDKSGIVQNGSRQLFNVSSISEKTLRCGKYKDLRTCCKQQCQQQVKSLSSQHRSTLASKNRLGPCASYTTRSKRFSAP